MAESIFQFESFEKQAAAIVERANIEAGRILQLARDQAVKMHEAGFDKAHAEGVKEGIAYGRAKGAEEAKAEEILRIAERTAPLLDRLESVVRRAEEAMARMRAQARVDLMELALAIASRIVRRQVELDPGIASRAVGEAIDALLDANRIVVRVHPDDRAVLEEYAGRLVALEGQALRIETAEGIDRGEAIVDTEHCRVDLRLGPQIEAICQALGMTAPAPASETAT